VDGVMDGKMVFVLEGLMVGLQVEEVEEEE
jgi:hypothetical protein